MHISTSEISLCRYCLDREGIRAQATESCGLCGGLLEQLDRNANEIVNALFEYEYETFLIGASIPQSILDKEDELRSRLKIKGKESVKSQITRMLTKQISKSTAKKPDYSRPDITILLSLSDGMISINPRSIWLSARYAKFTRGIAQRASDCKTCNGLGCADCNYVGKSGENVQSIASEFFCKKFLAESCNFVWLGSEDQNSLVKGSGRPFYVEVFRPKKRFAGSEHAKLSKMSFKSKNLRIFKVEQLEKRITEVPQFDIKCRVYINRNGTAATSELQAGEIQRNFSKALVNVHLSRRYRVVQRMIHSVKVKTTEDGRAELLIRCEGGIPIKKFVTGQDNSVEPNLSSLVSPYQLDPERPFDILDVKIKESQLDSSKRGRRTKVLADGNLGELLGNY